MNFNNPGCDTINSGIYTIYTNKVNQAILGYDDTLCFGDNPNTLIETSASTGSGNLTYQWYSSLDNINFNPINGETSNSFDTNVIYDTTYYYLQTTSSLYNVSCDTVSDTIEIIVNPLPSIISIQDTVICNNDSLVMPIETDSINSIFEWYATVSYTHLTLPTNREV